MDKGLRKSQNTLLASLLLSAWAPLATGIAVSMSSSATQIADFIRRTTEFLVLLLSWLVFRRLAGRRDVTAQQRQKWENLVHYSVALALALSGLVMFFMALSRRQQPGGSVLLGLGIAVLGFFVNFFFWRRYTLLQQAKAGVIIEAQRQLYLAKLLVDLGVICALGAVAFWPAHPGTKYVDTCGSLLVSGYLLWSALRSLQKRRAGQEADF